MKNNAIEISLLPCASKVLEKLKWVLENRKLLPKHQIGFCCQKSSVDAVFTFVNFILHSFSQKRIVLRIFVDIEQTYDNVNISKLQYCMNQLDITGDLVNIITNLFSSKQIFIKNNDGSLTDPQISDLGLVRVHL